MTPTSSNQGGNSLATMTDAELAATADKLRKRAALQSALDFADLSVARYEPPSDAVDDRFMRNLEISSRITRMQREVRDEIERRALKGASSHE